MTATKARELPPLDGETVVGVEQLVNEAIDLNLAVRRLLDCDLEEIPTAGQVLTRKLVLTRVNR